MRIEEIAMQNVRIYEMPACKMVSSGIGMFGEENFNTFEKWLSSQKRSLFPKDFLYGEQEGLIWLFMYEDGMTIPEEFEIIQFPGGLYAVATDIDHETDKKLMNAEIDKFLSENGLQRDTSRSELGNIITSPLVKKIMGYEQMDYYIPIKAK